MSERGVDVAVAVAVGVALCRDDHGRREVRAVIRVDDERLDARAWFLRAAV